MIVEGPFITFFVETDMVIVVLEVQASRGCTGYVGYVSKCVCLEMVSN